MTQVTDRDTKKGKCKGVNPKSSNTRYFGCREALENLKLHGVTNEGETQHHGLPFKDEPIVTGTKQVLKLVAIKPGTTNIPANVAPKALHDVIYEFSRAANNLEEQRDIVTQARLHEMFCLAEPALKFYEERPGEQNKFRGDSARMGTDNEYEDVFKQGDESHISLFCNPGQIS